MRQKPIPDTGHSDQGCDNGRAQSAIPGGKDYCCPNGVIRVIHARALLEGTRRRWPPGSRDRSGARRCCHVRKSDQSACWSGFSHYSYRFAPSQRNRTTTPARIWHAEARFRPCPCVSPLRHSGMPTFLGLSQFWRDEAAPSPPTVVCAILALLSRGTCVSYGLPSIILH